MTYHRLIEYPYISNFEKYKQKIYFIIIYFGHEKNMNMFHSECGKEYEYITKLNLNASFHSIRFGAQLKINLINKK